MLEDDDIDAVLQRLTDDLVLELAFEVRGCGSRPAPHPRPTTSMNTPSLHPPHRCITG
jgi:hypothetical protein